MPKLKSPKELENLREKILQKRKKDKTLISISSGTCGRASGSLRIVEAFKNAVKGYEDKIELKETGCHGFCSAEPNVIIFPEEIFYRNLKPEDAERIISSLVKGEILYELTYQDNGSKYPRLKEIPFYKDQKRILLSDNPLVDPTSIEDYISLGGYSSLSKALSMEPDAIVEEIKKSGLRGRGGAGFPTGRKWEIVRKQKSDVKYVICNADEGDPGAYMDRSLLEGNPHLVIEGMIIGGYAIGATEGWIYVRDEYPLAVQNVTKAIEDARKLGLLGKNILGSSFSFDIKIARGAGAFVCGEETALIASIEGKRGIPRQRPPYPAQKGLFGKPTNINNVETWGNVTRIIEKGADWYSSIGTEGSKGTKIFSLVGKVKNTGLVEVPMGMSINDLVYKVGGGGSNGKRIKAVQIGGPSGGCIPAELFHLPIDYESLTSAGAIMGSGGMIVMDEDTCMVDVARYFMNFLQDESCGKCVSCREGTQRMYEILTEIAEGRGTEEHLSLLEELGQIMKDASLCGLGQTAPNPVLSTIRYFKQEYVEHIKHKRCPAVVCKEIVSSPCQYLCPLNTDVPAYITLIAKGEFEKALEVVRKTNPLPIVCGRVCMAHCEKKCRAIEAGGAIAIKELKRFLTDWELRTGRIQDIKPSPKKYEERVAIIGSGPAGLTAGYYLVQMGYDVTIFEKLPVAGGMLVTGIPEYRLPKELLKKEIEFIERSGVKIKTSSPINNVDELLNNGYKAVLIAIGAHKNKKLGIPGEDVEGIIDPIKFLKAVNLKEELPFIGNRVGIIGGGNTAIDTARVALRLGAKEVTIFYRRTRAEMPAADSEIESALEEGVKIEYLVAPVRIFSENGRLKRVEFIRTQLGEPDESGRRKPVPIKGSEFVIELDSLLPAISQEPEIPENFGVKLTKWGTIAVDEETFKTSKEGIFACGDAVTGPSDVTTVMAQAKIAAESIHKYLRGELVKREYNLIRPTEFVEPIEVKDVPPSRCSMPKVPVEERKGNFQEVELGLTDDMAMKEAKRCLRCDWELVKKLLREGEGK